MNKRESCTAYYYYFAGCLVRHHKLSAIMSRLDEKNAFLSLFTILIFNRTQQLSHFYDV